MPLRNEWQGRFCVNFGALEEALIKEFKGLTRIAGTGFDQEDYLPD